MDPHLNGDGLYYPDYASGQALAISNSDLDMSSGTLFLDLPATLMSSGANWHAQATLFGINPDGTYMPLLSATYGFTTANGQAIPSLSFSEGLVPAAQKFINSH